MKILAQSSSNFKHTSEVSSAFRARAPMLVGWNSSYLSGAASSLQGLSSKNMEKGDFKWFASTFVGFFQILSFGVL